MSSYLNLDGKFSVESDKCTYSDETIISDYTYVVGVQTERICGCLSKTHTRAFSYETTVVEGTTVKPVQTKMQFKTERKVPKVRTVSFCCLRLSLVR